MTLKTGILTRAIVEGVYAQMKLKGDPSIIATDDQDTLKGIVNQGKEAENILKREGLSHLIDEAQKKAAR